MKTEMKPAFYALEPGTWRDYVTLLHPPYTAWHLSYVVFGAAAAPVVHLDRLGGAVLAFFLAVGIGAHALDEIQGRPLRTRISDAFLVAIAAVSLLGALILGVIAALTISLWVIPLIMFGEFAVLAYNLELSGGQFHSDMWFAVAWGAFPALVGYWASAERLSLEAVLVAAACMALSLAQRALSKQVRLIRRKVRTLEGRMVFQDGHEENINVSSLLSAPEAALRFMTVFVILLSLGFLIVRL